MKKNEYFIGTCIDMSHDGLGIVKYENMICFVKGMIPDESGKIKIIKVLKNYCVGRLIELHQVSNDRITPKCKSNKLCGGCHLQHLSTKGQQKFKTRRVKDT